MTTTKRLLELAALYEDKARAMRIAAAELNGHATTTKRKAVDTTLEQAISLRREQRPPKPKQRQRQLQRRPLDQTLAAITEHLHAAEEPQSIGQLRMALADRGFRIGRSHTLKVTRQVLGITKIGNGSHALWQLKGNGKPAAHRSKPGGAPSRQRALAQSEAKARIVAQILKDAGPLEIADLSAKAREAGVERLNGIYNYVTQGYIKRTGKGKHARYTFKALPPAAETPAVTSPPARD